MNIPTLETLTNEAMQLVDNGLESGDRGQVETLINKITSCTPMLLAAIQDDWDTTQKDQGWLLKLSKMSRHAVKNLKIEANYKWRTINAF